MKEEEQLSLDVCLYGLNQETSFKILNLGICTPRGVQRYENIHPEIK